MVDDRVAGYKKISTRYKNFRKRIRSIWESYNLVEYYSELVQKQVSKEVLQPVSFKPLMSNTMKMHDKSNTINLLIRLRTLENPRRAFLDSIGLFEDFLGQLVAFVYEDYPGKLLSNNMEFIPENQVKLISIIVDSANREEILTRLVEERIRSLFYGSPLDFFTKNKAKLEFGDYFRIRKNTMSQFQEVMSRRNIIVHNGGRVDRKYLQEVKDSKLKLGQVVSIPTDYLHKSIILLECLGAASTTLVLLNIYRQELEYHSNPLNRSYRAFERIFKD